MLKPVQARSYTFRDIIEGGFLYVDKTRYLYRSAVNFQAGFPCKTRLWLWESSSHVLLFRRVIFGAPFS